MANIQAQQNVLQLPTTNSDRLTESSTSDGFKSVATSLMIFEHHELDYLPNEMESGSNRRSPALLRAIDEHAELMDLS